MDMLMALARAAAALIKEGEHEAAIAVLRHIEALYTPAVTTTPPKH